MQLEQTLRTKLQMQGTPLVKALHIRGRDAASHILEALKTKARSISSGMQRETA